MKAGGYTPLKLQGVYGALAGQVAVAAIGGVIYSWYLNRLHMLDLRWSIPATFDKCGLVLAQCAAFQALASVGETNSTFPGAMR